MKFKRFTIWQFIPFLFIIPLIYISFGLHNKDIKISDSSQRSAETGDNILGDQNLSIIEPPSPKPENTDWGRPVTPTLSRPVSQIPQIPQVAADMNPELVREINPRISHNLFPQSQAETQFLIPTKKPEPQQTAPQVTRSVITTTTVFTNTILNFEGSPFNNVNPPDTVGAIGKDHYIQMVNGSSGAQFRIYDRSGTLVHGPISLESLGSGKCATGAGDPIVIYDQLADRWFMSEFQGQSNGNGVCHYISQTSDPAGSWFAYEYEMPSFPDYPKYGLWPSAYIGTANETGGVPAIYAFDREQMLIGAPAGFIRFAPPRLSGYDFQAFTPADLDGTNQPAINAPPLFLRHRDDEVHAGTTNGAADFIEIWTLIPDFQTPGNSSFTQIADIPISEFDSTMCGINTFQCVPQKDSFTLLDPVREILMHRVQYMNHGSHQSIVGNMVTDTNGNSKHGLFWFELRNTNGSWALYQDGVLDPDSEHRWMGSISMDVSQNIALMYNVSGANTFPSLRYSGRTADMPLGTLIPQEGSIAEGTGANSSSRYGDYNSLTLDPLDGCTFWATGQYNPSTQWSTRIATFKFPNCTSRPSFFLSRSTTPLVFYLGEPPAIPVKIAAGSDFTETVQIKAKLVENGQLLAVAPPTVSPIATIVTATAHIDARLEVGSHTVVFTATTPVQTSFISIDFTVIPTETLPITLLKPENNATYVSTTPNFEWAPPIGFEMFDLQIGSDPNFANIVHTFENIQASQFPLPSSLLNDTVYHWRVRPVNSKGAGPWATDSFRTEPAVGQCSAGTNRVPILQTGFENGLAGWESAGESNSWAISSDQVTTGLASIAAPAPNIASTQILTSPITTLAPIADIRWLAFDIWRDLESISSGCLDGLVLEVEKNGVWETVAPESAVSDPFNGEISSDFGNSQQGKQAWCGTQDWATSYINLSNYSGDIRLRYTLATDSSVGQEGVYIDNLQLYECNPQNLTYYFPLFFYTQDTP